MRRVGERIDERDGERFDLLRLEGAQALAQRILVETAHDFTLGAHAFVGLDGAGERRHRQGLVVDDPAAETARDVGARDLQHLPVAFGGDEADTGTGAGEHRVGGDGRAVHHMVDDLRVDARTLTDAEDAVEDADRLISRRGGDLGGPGLPRFFVNQQQICERAADIYTQTI